MSMDALQLICARERAHEENAIGVPCTTRSVAGPDPRSLLGVQIMVVRGWCRTLVRSPVIDFHFS